MITRPADMPDNVKAYENLRLGDLRGRNSALDIVLIPVAPCENHGTHLPTGTDLYISDDLATRAAVEYGKRHAETRLLLYPCISIASAAIRGPGSVKITSPQLRRALRYLCKRFFLQGYRRFVFVSAHGGVPHAGALDDVCRTLLRRGAKAVAPAAKASLRAYQGQFIENVLAAGAELPPNATELFLHDLHGGFMETSMMLAIAPHLVHPEYKSVPPHIAPDRWWLRAIERAVLAASRFLPLTEETRKDLAVGVRIGALDLSWILSGRRDGYHGTPAMSSPAIGDALLHAVASDIVRSMEEVFLQGADPLSYRSSAYLFNWLPRIAALAGAGIVFALYLLLR